MRYFVILYILKTKIVKNWNKLLFELSANNAKTLHVVDFNDFINKYRFLHLSRQLLYLMKSKHICVVIFSKHSTSTLCAAKGYFRSNIKISFYIWNIHKNSKTRLKIVQIWCFMSIIQMHFDINWNKLTETFSVWTQYSLCLKHETRWVHHGSNMSAD